MQQAEHMNANGKLGTPLSNLGVLSQVVNLERLVSTEGISSYNAPVVLSQMPYLELPLGVLQG